MHIPLVAIKACHEWEDGDQSRTSRTRAFTRYLKAHPTLTTLTVDQAYDLVPWDELDCFDEQDQLTFLVEVEQGRLHSWRGPASLGSAHGAATPALLP